MTFNTGNPIGSTDARDLSDNAENFDKALGSLDATWTDRLGVTRDTFEGALSKLSFYRVGTFAAGYTLTNMRQTLEYNGHEYSWAGTFPKVVPAGATPATSGGVGIAAWVDRTDVTVRSEIGSGIISIISYAHPEQFDAIANATGVTGVGEDSTQAFIDAAAECLATGKTLKANGKYRISGDIDLRYIPLDLADSTIYIDSSTAKVKAGGNASARNNPVQRLGTIQRIGGTNGNAEVRLSGVKGQNVYVEDVEHLLVWASTTVGVRDEEYSCAYSNFYLKRCTKLELNTDPLNASGSEDSNDGGSIQWINENNFYLNRTNTLIVDGSYDHNHNRFFAGTFEGASYITFNVGRDNRVYGERFEDSNVMITFGDTTQRNVIVNTYDDSEFSGGPDSVTTAAVIDSGLQNIVADDFRFYYKSEVVAQADINDIVLYPETGYTPYRLPYLQCIQGSAVGSMLLSDIMQCVEGDYFFYNTAMYDTSDTVKYRCYIQFFDKNMIRLTPTTDWILSPTITALSGQDLQNGSGVSGGRLRILKAAIDGGAAFVKVGFKSSSSQLSNGLARQLSVIRSSRSKPTELVLGNKRSNSVKLVTEIPTKGFAPLGYSVLKSDGLYRYINKFALDTFITAVADASNITVSAYSSVNTGDIIGINLTDRTTHWTTVAAHTLGAMTLTDAMPSLPAIGARVVFNRWGTEAIHNVV